MSKLLVSLFILLFAFLAAYLRACQLKAQGKRLHSQPIYHAMFVGFVAFIGLVTADAFEFTCASFNYPTLPSNAREIFSLLLVIAALIWIRPYRKTRPAVEKLIKICLLIAASVAILVTISIVLSLVFEAIKFFNFIPPQDFFFGLEWSPQASLDANGKAQIGSFGVLSVLSGTLLITAISIFFALPIGILSAVYLSFYAEPRQRKLIQPSIEILAGVPTIVYGFFAALLIAPILHSIGSRIGLSVSSESALAAGLTIGIMITPYITALSTNVLRALPKSLFNASLGLGATKSETIKNVMIPAALPGIAAGTLLAISRAIGETMIVVMAAGLIANLTFNPLDSVTTITVQILNLLTGDQEFNSPKTLAAFALGLTLFLITLVLNLYAHRIVQERSISFD